VFLSAHRCVVRQSQAKQAPNECAKARKSYFQQRIDTETFFPRLVDRNILASFVLQYFFRVRRSWSLCSHCPFSTRRQPPLLSLPLRLSCHNLYFCNPARFRSNVFLANFDAACNHFAEVASDVSRITSSPQEFMKFSAQKNTNPMAQARRRFQIQQYVHVVLFRLTSL
jgi:hypothetical protein